MRNIKQDKYKTIQDLTLAPLDAGGASGSGAHMRNLSISLRCNESPPPLSPRHKGAACVWGEAHVRNLGSSAAIGSDAAAQRISNGARAATSATARQAAQNIALKRDQARAIAPTSKAVAPTSKAVAPTSKAVAPTSKAVTYGSHAWRGCHMFKAHTHV